MHSHPFDLSKEFPCLFRFDEILFVAYSWQIPFIALVQNSNEGMPLIGIDQTVLRSENESPCRRSSNHNEGVIASRKLVIAVDSTQEALLKQEDLDGDGLITVDDSGPKVWSGVRRFPDTSTD